MEQREPDREAGTETAAQRGGIVSVSGASPRLALTAATQLEAVVPSADGLIVDLPELESAATAALELRRWATALGEAETTRIALAPLDGPGSRAAAVAAAQTAAAGGEPGTVSMPAAAAPMIRTGWLRSDPTAGGNVRLRWRGPGDSGIADRGGLPTTEPWPMLGRSKQLLAIASAWSACCEGERRLLMLAGEPGAGKTRLAGEAAREILGGGGQVLYGSAEEQETTPYTAFVAALSGPGAETGAAASPFAALVRDALPAADGPTSAGIGSERSVLFSAAVAELEHRAKQGPVALFIEDLHFCGLSSLQLLRHLFCSADLSRLLIVASYRPGALESGSAETVAISGLRTEPGSSHIELAPLDQRSLRGLAASFGVERDDLDQISDIVGRETGGLPLYGCELLGSLAAEGPAAAATRLPRSLQLLISTRVHMLGSDAYEQICAASVAGASFDPKIVAAACGLPPGGLDRSLALAQRAGLLRAELDRYRFAHAITHQCLYQELPPARRGELHRALALALEQAAGSTAVEPGEIVRHYQRAEPPDPARASEWAAEAAERALERFDAGASARWYELASQLYQEAGGDEPQRRCDLLLGWGAALRLDGDGRFRETLLSAARLALELDDPDRLSAAVLTNNRGFVSAIGEFDRERLTMLELAVERVSDERRRALVLAQLALELTFAPERDRRHALAAEALALAERVDEPRLRARVLNRSLIARWEPGNARERIHLADDLIKTGSRLEDPLDLFYGLHWRAAAQIEACAVDEAKRSINEEARIAARLGDPTASWLSACSQALVHALAGRLDEAESEAERAMVLGRDSEQPDALPFYASQIASIRWKQGRLAELAPLLDAALEHHPGLPGFRSLVALARITAGNADGAREVLAVDSVDGFRKLPRDPTWFGGAATYAHVAAELGDRKAAAQLQELLEPLAGRLATTSVSVWGLTDHALGRLAGTLAEHQQAIVRLERSIAEYRRLAAPIWLAQASFDLAVTLEAAGVQGERADALRAEAAGIAARHGAALPFSAAPGSLEQLGDADPGKGSRRAFERLSELDLTERQRAIIGLMARGMSNAEIAAELVISPSTVKRHLENAATRTGVRGRKGLMALLYD